MMNHNPKNVLTPITDDWETPLFASMPVVIGGGTGIPLTVVNVNNDVSDSFSGTENLSKLLSYALYYQFKIGEIKEGDEVHIAIPSLVGKDLDRNYVQASFVIFWYSLAETLNQKIKETFPNKNLMAAIVSPSGDLYETSDRYCDGVFKLVDPSFYNLDQAFCHTLLVRIGPNLEIEIDEPEISP